MWDPYSSFSAGDILPQFLERYIKHPPFHNPTMYASALMYTWHLLLISHVHLSTVTFLLYSYLQPPNVHVHMLHIADFASSTLVSHCCRKSSQQRDTTSAPRTVHSDICVSMPKRSLGGSQSFITFIDDCTRKVWAYSIKSKDEALATFA